MFEKKFHSGLTSLRASDPDGSIPCALWYPTMMAAQTVRHGIYDFHVTKKAAIATGQHPVVVMSHGSGGTRYDHCKLAEFLSQYGFIVLAPEHPQNNFFDDNGNGSAKTYQNRSRHLTSCLDALLEDESWNGSIHQDQISILGFSLGGFSALTSVGARPNVEGLRHHLRQNREFDPLFTSYEVIVRDGFEDTYLPVHYDARFKACIAFAPVSGGLFPKDSLKGVTVPVQIFRAERDAILRDPFHAQEIRKNLPVDCDFHIIEKAGHFSFLSPVRPDVKDRLGELAYDDIGFDRPLEHNKIYHFVLNFLHKALS